MSFLGSNATPPRRAPARAPGQHARVLLPGDDVRVGDDEPVAGDPARALDAEPAGGAEDLHDAVARRVHLRVARDPRGRRRHVRLRPVDARERVERAQRVQQRPGRRQDRVELAQDRRALDLAPDVRVRRQRERAEHPGDPKPHAGGQHRAEHAVDGGERGRAQAGAQARADPLEARPRARRRPRAPRSARTPAPTASRGRRRAPGADPRAQPGADAKPTSASAPATNPCAHPNSARSTTTPTISQSMPVKIRAYSYP